MRWSEEPTWSLQRARILIPLLPFTFHFPTRYRAAGARALLIPSLLLTFNLSPATARGEMHGARGKGHGERGGEKKSAGQGVWILRRPL